jgi:hypothetical protein
MIVRELFGIKPGDGSPEELRRRLKEELEAHRSSL